MTASEQNAEQLEDGDRQPCTCKPDCSKPCKGYCGCERCREVYEDFLSMPEV